MSHEDSDEDLHLNEKENEDDELGVHRDDDPLKCRMYEQEYPSVDDIIVVEVHKMAEMGAYCSLLEYNNMEGMLLFSELQRKRIRSVKRVIREGRREMVQVLRVNQEKGYIDLSKKRVTPEDKPAVEERWNKSKAVHSIMRQVAVVTGRQVKNANGQMSLIPKYTMKQLYELFGWEMAKKFGHCYEAFKWAMSNWDECLEKFPQIPEDVRKPLYKNIEKRLKPQLVTVRSNIEVTCFTSEGVDAIKRALKAGLAESTETLQLSIKLVAPPLFTISVSTLYHEQGKQLVTKAAKKISDTIKQSGGDCVIKTEAEVIAMEI